MIYLVSDRVGGIDFESYRRYLASVRDQLPEAAYAFASDARHFDLTSRRSLHDAWLDSVTIREDASGSRHEIRRLAIDVVLLGPFHDRRIHLRYRGVHAYRFDVSAGEGIRFTHTAHGDLLMHELRLRPGGGVVHELVFEREGNLLIECEDFSHDQVMLDGEQD